MILKRIKDKWDRLSRKDWNDNMTIIEKNFNNVVDVVSNQAYNQVVESATLIWKEPVNTFSDLVTTYPNPEVGWTVMAREIVTGFDGKGINKVYRYNGSEWTEIQQILADAVNEVDHRLTTQLAQIAINVKSLGAVGDGVTDDTLAIQAALDTRKNVFIPSGNYLITDTLMYYTKQEIYGVGDDSNIVSQINGKPIIKNAEAFFNTHFHKFRILGNGSESHGILMENGYEHMYINYVSIVNVGGNSLHLDNIYGLHSVGLHFVGSANSNYGIYAIGSNACSFSGALLKSFQNGIHTIWTYKFSVFESLIESNYGTGIYAQRGNSLSIKDNYFENNGIVDGASSYDIHLDTDSEDRPHSHVSIQDCYFRSNLTANTVKISAKVRNGAIKNVMILDSAKLPYQTHRYNIDLKNDGYILVENINTTEINDNNQSNLITVVNDVLPIRTNRPIKMQYLDSATGTSVSGDIPCNINYHHVQFGGLTQVNFEITNIDTSGLSTGSLVVISLPIKRSIYSGFFTSPLHYNGSNADVKLLYLTINNKPFINIQKMPTETSPNTSFRVSHLAGLDRLLGSISYY